MAREPEQLSNEFEGRGPKKSGLVARLFSGAARVHGYVPALITLAAAICLNLIFKAVFGANFAGIFFIYILAIIIGAWCGYGPGIMMVLLVAAGVPYLVTPKFSIRNVNAGGVTSLVLVSLVISRTAQLRRRSEAMLLGMNAELDRRVRLQTEQLAQANEDLRERLAELETLYRDLPVGLCLLDPQLRYVRVNERLAAIHGISPAEHIGRKPSEVPPHSVMVLLEPLFQQVLDTGRPCLNYELSGSVPDRTLLMSAAVVRAEDGTVVGVQVIKQDITERKLAETALKKTNDDLRRANADLEQFAYSASHDLQEPLRMVTLFTQLLQETCKGLGPEAESYIAQAVLGANRLERLMRDLRSYIQVFGAGTDVRIAPVDGTAVLARVLESMAASIRDSQAQIEWTPLPKVYMWEVHLQQLLQNLIGNALKYKGADAPKIFVSADRQDASWLFSVRDNGIGIDPRYARQIFGVFKRLHGREQYDGTGIGLAICQKILDRYGGQIWVESELGKGSTFFFVVPATQDERVHTVAADSSSGR